MDSVLRKRRILYVDHTSVLGGGELALLALVKELDRTRFEPIVLLLSHGPFVEEMAPLAQTEVLEMPKELLDARRESMQGSSGLPWRKAAALLRYIVRLSRRIEELRPDLIHANSLKADILCGLIGRYGGFPVVWHIRDRIDEDYLPSLAVRIFRAACRWMPAGLIANSRATLESLNLPPTKPAVMISSGIDLEPFRRAGAEARSLTEALVSNDGVRIGLIGRICPWKGQEVFLHAAALVAAQAKPVRFYIVGAPLFGEDAFEAEMRNLAQQLGIAELVEFTGFLRNMPEVVGRLDMVVHASTIPEPFGQVVVQGMAAGKPVVASEGGGPSEIINDGVTGYLAPRGDAKLLAGRILSVLADGEAAAAIATRGQQHVLARYDTTMTTRRVEDFYEELLSARA